MRRIVLLLLAVTGIIAADLPSAFADKPTWSPKPFGLGPRIPWTTSRVVGSPDPPPPFRVELAFPNLKETNPIYLKHEPGTNNFFLVHQARAWSGAGRIRRFKNEPDVAESELLWETDRLIYGLTFHPDYEQNGYVYVVHNGPLSAENKQNRISRFTVDRQPPYRFDPKSELVILEWDSNGHNGGDIGFGPDGYLYFPTGDGTSDSDTIDSGQDITNLLAIMVRIDVDHFDGDRPYSIPPDNPFLDVPGARPEAWAFGFRNPWRMAFDPQTGHLWVGNNGQDLWEQVFFVRRGDNFGWSVYEGSHPFQLGRRRGPAPIVKPAAEHHHSEFRSLTGGVVYYGSKLPDLNGTYVYGDFSTGRIWGVRHDGTQVTWNKELARTTLQITGFANSPDGDLLICDHGGGIYRMVPTPQETSQGEFPTRLSETGLFTSTAEHAVDPALVPYSVNAPQWADGAMQERWLALPGSSQIDVAGDKTFTLPEGTVLMKTLWLETEAGNPASRRRVETQLLTRQLGQWDGYSYVWNDEQTDAELVPALGHDRVLTIKDAREESGVRQQRWRFASRTECMACHSRAATFVLGFKTLQLNKQHDYGVVIDEQLRTLEHTGIFRVSWLSHIDEMLAREKRVRGMLFPDFQPAFRVAGKRVPPWLHLHDGADFSQDWMVPAEVLIARRARAEWNQRWAAMRKSLQDQPRYTTLLPKRPFEYEHLVNPYDVTQNLNQRARSYLHTNCAVCHVLAGGGNSLLELDYAANREKTRLFDVVPQHDRFGIAAAKLVAPGDPYRSVLLYRMAKLGGGRMPRVGSNVVDEQGLRMIHDWIAQMTPVENMAPPDLAAVKARQQQLATIERLRGASSTTNAPLREKLIEQLLSDASGGLLLLRALDDAQLAPLVARDVIAKASSLELAPSRDLFERFIPFDQRIKRLGATVNPADILLLSGDAGRGKHLFFNAAGVQCKSCHRIGEGPELVGPDLTHVGKANDREALLESLLEPSKKIDPKFQAVAIETSAGQVLTGVLVARTDAEVVLKDAQNKEIRISAAQIEQLVPSTKSFMPELLLRDLTAEQVADLLEFLQSLK